MKLTPITWRSQYEIDTDCTYLVRIGEKVFVAAPFIYEEGKMWFYSAADRIYYNLKDVAELYRIELTN